MAGQHERTDDSDSALQFSRRMLSHNLLAGAIAVAGTVVVAKDLSMTLSVSLGAALGVINFRWLDHSLKAILSSGSAKPPAGTAMKMIWRYGLIFVVAAGAIQFPVLQLSGILIGIIAVSAGSALIEMAYRMYFAAVGRETF